MALEKAIKSSGNTGFKFQKAGDSLKGYYLGTTRKPINGVDADVHSFRTSEGIKTVIGQANIKTQFRDNGISPGTWVEVTFTGNMQSLKAGRTMKLYDISFDRADVDTGAPEGEDGSDDGYSESFDDSPESELGSEGEAADEVAVKVASKARLASTPSPAAQSKAQALLSGRHKSQL